MGKGDLYFLRGSMGSFWELADNGERSGAVGQEVPGPGTTRRVAYSRPTAKHGSDKELKMRRNPISETVLDPNGEGGPGEWFRAQTLNWAL